jgi:2-aminobenzoate-CoA ligase
MQRELDYRQGRVPARTEDTFCRDALPPPHLWPDIYYRGASEVAYPARLNCGAELLDAHVASGNGERLAFYYSGTQWTYREILQLSNKIAQVLLEDFGLIPGNRVLLRGPNTPWLVAAWFAVIKAGCVVVCTPSLLRVRELVPLIRKAQINLCVTDAAVAGECDEAVVTAGRDVKVVRFNTVVPLSLEERAASKDGHFETHDTAAEDVAIIAFTSGTTGDPKGTMHFHRDLLAVSDCYGRHIVNAAADDIFCGTPPLAFTFALGGLLLFPMRIGASAVLLDQGSPQHLLDAIQRYRATICFTSPTGYRAMTGMLGQFDISSLKKCISAGEPLPLSTFQAWEKMTGLKIVDGIGSTELLHIFVSAEKGDIRPGSLGKAVPGYRVCVLDENGVPVSPGTVGRLAVRGPTGAGISRTWKDNGNTFSKVGTSLGTHVVWTKMVIFGMWPAWTT